jgi:hypothetical protein
MQKGKVLTRTKRAIIEHFRRKFYKEVIDPIFVSDLTRDIRARAGMYLDYIFMLLTYPLMRT